MSDITLFNFEGSQVRVVLDGKGEPWFVAKDIATAFEHTDVSVMVSRLDDEERGTNSACTPGGTQDVLTISESGLYAIILTSRKPNAKRFKRWVTSEVLPSIRKTGSYSQNAVPAMSQRTQQDVERQTILEFTAFALKHVPTIRPEMALACTARALTSTGLMTKTAHEEMRNMLSVDWDKAPSLTPTQIGEKLGGVKPTLVNKMLEARGLQKKRGKKWEPTEEGKEHAGAVSYQSEHGEHKGIQLKWAPEVVDLLQEPLEDIQTSKTKLLT